MDMMDRNPMLQGLQNPVPGIGIIPGKVILDWDIISDHQANADDPSVAGECYPMGNKDINHDAMPGNMSIGMRELRNGEVMDGEPNERGIASVAGLRFADYDSQRSLQDNWYFQGIVATESRVSSDQDPDHGYAIIRAGTVSIINNGEEPFYPGQYACWQMPKAPFGQPGVLLDPVNYRARYGTPKTKWMPEVVPFDPTDMSTHMAGAFANMKHSKVDRDPGSADIMLPDFFVRNGAHSAKALNQLQEEAMAFRFGINGMILRALETLMRKGHIQFGNGNYTEETAATEVREFAKDTLKLWTTNPAEHGLQHEILADILMRNLNPGDPDRIAAERRFLETHGSTDGTTRTWNSMATNEMRSSSDDMFRLLMVNLPEVFITGITSTWYSATNSIIGKPMNSAAPADTLHVMLGHFVL
jgi:hypothetical protein